MRYEATSVIGLELVPLPPLNELPAFDAGAHIDLLLPGGLTRQYSLLNDPAERQRYQIAVNKDAHSRGGSRCVHERVRVGDVLTISAPRNHFPLDESAVLQVFIAGGIGITPIMSMIARCRTRGLPWRLYYAARTREYAAFVDTLEAWPKGPDAQVQFNFDQAPGGKMLDLAAVLASVPADAHVYCCGPLPLLAAFEAATAHRPAGQVHREYFAASEAAATAGGFSVELARSGRSVQVQAGESILDCLMAIGVEPPHSCREGICGTCEVRVLEGVPDHRDMVLSAAERARNDRLMICCSGAKSPRLVLDL